MSIRRQIMPATDNQFTAPALKRGTPIWYEVAFIVIAVDISLMALTVVWEEAPEMEYFFRDFMEKAVDGSFGKEGSCALNQCI